MERIIGEIEMVSQQIFEPFCGAGGMGFGFSKYFQVTYAVDIMPAAVDTYRSNHPETSVKQKDIRTISGVRGDFDGITGVIGGPPCQQWSIINTRKKANDPRAHLSFEFMRLVEEIKPKFFVLENVPSAPKEAKFKVESVGRQLGYDVMSLHVNAAQFGAAQRRKRWVVIGRRDQEWRGLTYAEPRTVQDAFQGIHENWGMMHSSQGVLARLAETNSEEWMPISPGGFKNAIKLRWDAPSPAVVNLKKVYMVHPGENRNISLAEAAALQGFPADYVWKGTESDIAQMIANCMPVELADAVARSLVN